MDERESLLPNDGPAATASTPSRSPSSACIRSLRFFAALLAFTTFVAVASFLLSSPGWLSGGVPVSLAKEANVSLVMRHLKNLEAIARSKPEYGGSRSTTRGHNASVEYVVDFLKNHTNYRVWTQPVTVLEQTDFSPPTLIAHSTPPSLDVNVTDPLTAPTRTYVAGQEVATFRGSGKGILDTSLAFHVAGCDPLLDLAIFTTRRMAVAVVGGFNAVPGRGIDPRCPTVCSRAAAAVRAGAKGLIIYPSLTSTGYPRPLNPVTRWRCTEEDTGVINAVPAVVMSQSAGQDILQRTISPEGLRVTIATNTTFGHVVTRNVLAETDTGDENKVVFMTAHLDTVPAGPGVNDDGSGSMATLELAHAFYRSGLVNSSKARVRFGWWSAEETGLEGSRYYVQDLYDRDPDELYKVKMNIDTDMIGSPNYVRGVWDGHGLEDNRTRGPAGVIQDVIEGWFEKQGLPTVPFPFNGRSDFVAFLDKGIPAGGVITGEDEIKTLEEAELFGGIAGMVLDPCYHQLCDTTESLRGPGAVVLKQNLAALGHTMERFVMEDDLEGLLAGRVPI
ncbi:hypothetical protein HK101_009158 [Irineochytrium annulatum]|nr:hypothetical protein HK101_009158 [Irineochytrium annulatum]